MSCRSVQVAHDLVDELMARQLAPTVEILSASSPHASVQVIAQLEADNFPHLTRIVHALDAGGISILRTLSSKDVAVPGRI